MTNKRALAILIVGIIVLIIGAFFKIMHWPGAKLLLIFGLAAEAIALIILIIKSLNAPTINK